MHRESVNTLFSENRSGLAFGGGSWSDVCRSGRFVFFGSKVLGQTGQIHLFKIPKTWKCGDMAISIFPLRSTFNEGSVTRLIKLTVQKISLVST